MTKALPPAMLQVRQHALSGAQPGLLTAALIEALPRQQTMRDWQAIWRRLFPGRMIGRDVDTELDFHLEGRADELVDEGLSEAEAHDEVLRRFGDVDSVRAQCAEFSRQRVAREELWTMVESIAQDVRFAARALLKNAGFSAVIVLTLALGIGTTTAIFSVVNGVLLRPLPYKDPDRLAMIWENDRATGTVREAASVPDFFDFQARTRTFSDMAMFAVVGPATMTGDDGEPRQVGASGVGHNLAEVLGISPQIGRDIGATEDQPGGELVAVLADGFWHSAFNGDPSVLGKSIRLDGQTYTIVGVLPAGLDFPSKRTDLWVPLQQGPTTVPRATHWVRQIGRIAPGFTVEDAHEEMVQIAAELEAEHTENTNRGAFVEPLADFTRGNLRLMLWVLFAAVSAVLLIACANVANLLLARGASRTQEVAVCLALGASTRRLVRRFLAESFLLTGVAMVAGVALAVVGLRALLAIAPGAVLAVGEVSVDGLVLAFALTTSALIGIGFGLIPAAQARRLDLQTELKEGRSQAEAAAHSKMWLRRLLVSGQLAMAVVLLVAAGLLIGTLWNLQRVDPGFNAESTLRVDFQLPASRYPRDFTVFPNWVEIHTFNRELLDRVRALPGVRSAALTSNHPLQAGFTNSFGIVGRPPDPDKGEMTTRMVSADYFETVGVRLVRGRMFSPADTVDARLVLILNQAAVDRHFPDEDPIGQEIQFWGPISREIIGIVENEKMHGLDRDPPPAMYANVAQAPPVGALTLMVRTSGDPRQLLPAVRDTVWALDRDLAVFNIATMDETLAGAVARERFASVLLTIFAVIAVFIASLGVYGLLSYLVAQRGHEVGVRMALGASRKEILRLVISQGLAMTVAGLVVGLVGAVAVARLMAGLLFGVSPTEPLAYVAVVGCLVGAALVACTLPAVRASRIDPIISLRGE